MRIRAKGALVAIGIALMMASAQGTPRPAEPLHARINTTDLERFVALWKKTKGHPTAAQLDSEYIAKGGQGVKIFTPMRIVNGANMAAQISAHRDWYQQAVSKCLPWVYQNNVQLRFIYTRLHRLLPEKPLPQIYIVIGGANSGGTAGPGAQVLGLEIVCRDGPTRQKFREELKTFFAHETAHTFQGDINSNPNVAREPLLALILQEGGADYIASVVTGAPPNAAREAYGRGHEAELWAQFEKDRAVANAHYKNGFDSVGREAMGHWLYNADQGKLAGWETDMGYWLGMQIAKAYVDRAADRRAAILDVLALDDPAEILRKSGYAQKLTR